MTKTQYFQPEGKPVIAVKAADAPQPQAAHITPASVTQSPNTPAPAKSKVPASKPRAKRGDTKAKIEAAAVSLFARASIDGVSTKQISEAAGVSEGALYRHFSGKDALARTLLLKEHVRLAVLLRAVQQSSERLETKVSAIVDAYCAAADEDWDLFRYYLLHFHRFASLRGEPVTDSPMQAAINIIEQAQVKGEMPRNNAAQSDAPLRAAMALGVVMQTATAKVYGQIDGPLQAYAPQFKAAVMAVLLSQD